MPPPLRHSRRSEELSRPHRRPRSRRGLWPELHALNRRPDAEALPPHTSDRREIRADVSELHAEALAANALAFLDSAEARRRHRCCGASDSKCAAKADVGLAAPDEPRRLSADT